MSKKWSKSPFRYTCLDPLDEETCVRVLAIIGHAWLTLAEPGEVKHKQLLQDALNDLAEHKHEQGPPKQTFVSDN